MSDVKMVWWLVRKLNSIVETVGCSIKVLNEASNICHHNANNPGENLIWVTDLSSWKLSTMSNTNIAIQYSLENNQYWLYNIICWAFISNLSYTHYHFEQTKHNFRFKSLQTLRPQNNDTCPDKT